MRAPLEPFLVEEKDGEENVLRYRKAAASAERAPAAAMPKDTARREFPSWLREMAPVEAPRAAPLSPSSAFEEEIGADCPSGGVARPIAKRRLSAAGSCIG